MTTIAIDLQPQCLFSCYAANDERHVHQPEQIVDELNRQARHAQLRLLVENISAAQSTLCAGLTGNQPHPQHSRQYFMFDRISHLLHKVEQCRGLHFLPGIPCPADYNHEIEIEGDGSLSAYFHDAGQKRSTGLMEWLFANQASTIIIGGLATEYAIRKTACQLRWYGHNWQVIVNLAACRGYTPEGILRAVADMRQAGVVVVNDGNELENMLSKQAHQDQALYCI